MMVNDFSEYCINDTANIREALVALNRISSDVLTLFVVNSKREVIGTVTDGDIRRGLIERGTLDVNITEIMHSDFYYLEKDQINVSLFKKIKSKGIVLLPIIQNKEIIGILNLKQKKSLLPVDAVLMAGGKGLRLRPLTEQTPKPLLKIGEKAIIDYNIDSLVEFGIENINVTVNYLAEQIKTHFQKPVNGIKVRCIEEPYYLGTIGSVKFVEKFHNDTILIMNSDLFTNINYEDFYLHFKETNADLTIATIPYSMPIPYGIFDIENGLIKGIKEKPTFNYYANSGIYLIKKNLLDLIPEGEFFNATDFAEKLVKEGFRVVSFPLIGYWIDIGKPEDYKKAQDFVKYV